MTKAQMRVLIVMLSPAVMAYYVWEALIEWWDDTVESWRGA